MKYTFRPYHILVLAVLLLVVWAFTTGWECGFLGGCTEYYSPSFRGATRLATVIILGAIGMASDYSRDFEIKLPKTKEKGGFIEKDYSYLFDDLQSPEERRIAESIKQRLIKLNSKT